MRNDDIVTIRDVDDRSVSHIQLCQTLKSSIIVTEIIRIPNVCAGSTKITCNLVAISCLYLG